MTEKPRVKLIIRGLNALMKSQPAVDAVASRGAAIARAAGPNFEMVVKPHRYRARVYVRAANDEGRKEEAREKRLTRALDAGR